jgi:hypothetical protein
LKKTITKMGDREDGGVSQGIPLSSNPSTAKKKKPKIPYL